LGSFVKLAIAGTTLLRGGAPNLAQPSLLQFLHLQRVLLEQSGRAGTKSSFRPASVKASFSDLAAAPSLCQKKYYTKTSGVSTWGCNKGISF